MTTWENRDLPVLRALATTDDENVRNGFLMLRLGRTGTLELSLADQEIHEAVLVLADVGYVEGNEPSYDTGGGATFTRFRVTGRGQQALGQWPLFHDLISPETMAELLDRLAEEAPSDEESENLRRAANYIRKVSSGVVRAAGTAATSQLLRNALGLP